MGTKLPTMLGVLTVFSLLVAVFGANCPCETEDLCVPITTVYDNEVYAFVNNVDQSTWSKFDWDKLTTVALVGWYSPEIMCYGHQSGTRVVSLVDFEVSELTDPDARARWVQTQLADVQSKFLDGINIDTEAEIAKDSPEEQGLTLLVQEATDAFHQAIDGSQVTFDIAWSPDHIDGRYYDAVGLANAADFLFVMSYDEQSQILDGDCKAMANSGIEKTSSGVSKFLDLGIPASKLVLGVPWYGYNYPCTTLTQENVCFIPYVPFRGVNCSDAAGSQITYTSILDILQTSTTGRLWDDDAKSPYFNFKDGNNDHQMWYDDPESLGYKYQYAQSIGMKGVGMWNAVFLDNSDTQEGEKQRQEMWGALPSYKKNNEV